MMFSTIRVLLSVSRFLVFLFMFGSLAYPVGAEVLNVPSMDYPTIQSAIAVAVSNVDTVEVSNGWYPENIDFLGKNITVRSANGAEFTTIDGSAGGASTVIFQGSELPTARLVGFTITGGTGTLSSGYFFGGGILIRYGAAPTISQCVIAGNSAEGGGGVSVMNSSPTIEDCVIEGNTAIDSGGGISVGGSQAAPMITRCVIRNNTATSGAGVRVINSAQGTFTACTVKNNTAADQWDGGGFSIQSDSTPRILSCLITGNTAGVGGGIFSSDSSPNVTNSTIVGNFATETNPDWQGGGIYVRWSTSPTIGVTNSIIWGNSPNQVQLNSSSITLTYSAVEGGWPGTGNTDENPSFAGPNDFHLLSGSPCIDAGDNQASSLPAVDIDGESRFMDGDGDQAVIVDMGADEFAGNIFSDGFEDGDTSSWSISVS